MNITTKSDVVGAFSSGICLIHCLATPIFFAAHTGSMNEVPSWWAYIDLLFLGIAFLSIYKSTEQSSNPKVPLFMWISWAALSFIVLNEKVEFLHLPHDLIFIPSIALIVLHVYNQKYCHSCVKGNTDNKSIISQKTIV